MNGKRFLDIFICCLAAAVMILSYIYMEQSMLKYILLAIFAGVILCFAILAALDAERIGRRRKKFRNSRGRSKGIHSLILLDEENQEIAEWNIAGKISVLIGRDNHRENVDVNLMNTAFAGMVDRQHAVLNYTAGQWYIEDLDSTNGIRIQKRDGMLYEVASGQPCLIEKGDVLIIGLTKLEAR